MSKRFNKQSPSDFGLEYVNGKFVSLKDGSEWEQGNEAINKIICKKAFWKFVASKSKRYEDEN